MVFKSAINSPADYKFKQQSCASRIAPCPNCASGVRCPFRSAQEG